MGVKSGIMKYELLLSKKLSYRIKKLLCGLFFAVVMLPAIAVFAQMPVAIDLSSEASREQSVVLLSEGFFERKAEALAAAAENNWPVRGETVDGRLFEIMALVDGRPLYAITMNVNAGISTAAHEVRNYSPYDVDGTDVVIGVWDGGDVRSTHQEFGGRVTLKNSAGNNNHATHVAGTIGAAGVDAAALGMAPAAAIHSYDWNDDLAEMTAVAAAGAEQANKLYHSNHSYGYIAGWAWGDWSGSSGWHWWGWPLADREDRAFGRYNAHAYDWDELCFNAPYFLPFKASGNDRGDGMPSPGATFYYWDSGWQSKPYDAETDPFADNHKDGGYNTVSYQSVSKNIMTVGAVNAAVTSGQRDPAKATMASFSCWGPTDDGRIKPDIVANGVSLYSSTAGSNSEYGTASGTSMAAPNAAGSAVLLSEYYRNRFTDQNMRAAMLKGLIIHTADDLGNAGPDYRYGWGLMNTAAAAEHIRRHSDSADAQSMLEDVLEETQTNRYVLTWNGTDDIRATLSWTDPPGPVQSGLNSTNRVLVNDLDLRIVDMAGAVWLPYVLDPFNPSLAATTGTNRLDNVEQVNIPSSGFGATGQEFFYVEVTHAGVLSGVEQAYALLISGQAATNNAYMTLHNLRQSYNGSPRIVTVITQPPGLDVEITYDGVTDPPVELGSYAVTGTVTEAHWQGQVSGVLHVLAPDRGTIFMFE